MNNVTGFDQVLAAQIGIEPTGATGYRVVWLGKTITFNRHPAEEANWNDALEWCLAAGERMAPVLRAQCAAPVTACDCPVTAASLPASTLPMKGSM